VPTNNNILVQLSKILSVSPIYGLPHPSVGAVLEIFSVKKEMEEQNV
jgi:hypothetical protein